MTAIDKLKSLLQSPEYSSEQAADSIDDLNHFEIARLLHGLETEEKVRVFELLKTDEKKQEVLYETDIESRMEIIDTLGKEDLAPLLEGMPVDEVTDIIQEHDSEFQEEILSQMVPQDAVVIKNLIHYEEETAGGMMNPVFNKTLAKDLAGDLLMKLIRSPSPDHSQYFFVTNEQSELLGYFKLRDLLNVPASSTALQIVRDTTPKVHLLDSCEKVANLMDHEHMSTLPVVNDKNIIQGIITFDDVLRVMKDEASEDFFMMVGTAKIDPFAKKTINKVRARAPWLLTTFIGGLVSAAILHAFQFKVEEFTTLLFFIPFVLGLAGNVGIQGATVIVRGLATGDIQQDNLRRVVTSELYVGLINGTIFGVLCGGLIALFAGPLLNTSPVLGVAVGLGIILAVATASLIGSLTPLFFLNMKIDPAISAGPMVTTFNDILGLFIYLSTSVFIYSTLG